MNNWNNGLTPLDLGWSESLDYNQRNPTFYYFWTMAWVYTYDHNPLLLEIADNLL